ncbi:hypothetical protein [Bosea sp. FBZP-16]|uniref:hypothetical protein n=1 Tax=Bosea sp. FBZP-16 TaxID=2065382 RepID=UPI000C318147|nr:hypothetical protein [Bosea sp. FBZP-16]
MKPIGPTFGAELDAAGLGGLPISWSGDGDLQGLAGLSTKQKSGVKAVLAAHDANRMPLTALKDEAFSLITSVISTTAQLNMSATMAVIAGAPADQRSAEEQSFAETFAAGVAWIQAVRHRMQELADRGGVTPAGEKRWPKPKQSVVDLAAMY